MAGCSQGSGGHPLHMAFVRACHVHHAKCSCLASFSSMWVILHCSPRYGQRPTGPVVLTGRGGMASGAASAFQVRAVTSLQPTFPLLSGCDRVLAPEQVARCGDHHAVAPVCVCARAHGSRVRCAADLQGTPRGRKYGPHTWATDSSLTRTH